mmetsp:Transcript_8901/g.13466  ORF Transcript_8901/g.13466 Transcript_8901/m.13466 type:complete len:213 (-) Transcript_8901:23-661(-)
MKIKENLVRSLDLLQGCGLLKFKWVKWERRICLYLLMYLTTLNQVETQWLQYRKNQSYTLKHRNSLILQVPHFHPNAGDSGSESPVKLQQSQKDCIFRKVPALAQVFLLRILYRISSRRITHVRLTALKLTQSCLRQTTKKITLSVTLVQRNISFQNDAGTSVLNAALLFATNMARRHTIILLRARFREHAYVTCVLESISAIVQSLGIDQC